MKFTINQNVLHAALGKVIKAVSTRSTLPILGNIKVVADASDQTLSLAATDLAVGIVLYMDADVDESGATTMPAKQLTALISAISGSVTMVRNNKTERMTISHASGNATLNCISAEDFPLVPTDDSDIEHVATIDDVNLFVSNCKLCSKFAARENSGQPTIEGVNFNGHMVATSGYALAKCDFSIDDRVNVIIPATCLSKALPVLNDASSIDVYADDRQVRFIADGFVVTCQLIDARYPDVSSFGNNQSTTKFTVDAEAMTKAINLAKVTLDAENRITLNVDEDGVFTLSTGDAGETSSVTVNASFEMSEPITIISNVAYLTDSLPSSGNVEISLMSPRRPLELRYGDTLCVIMPMR